MASKVRYVFKMNSFDSHITSVQIKETVEIMREKYWKNWKKKLHQMNKLFVLKNKKQWNKNKMKFLLGRRFMSQLLN